MSVKKFLISDESQVLADKRRKAELAVLVYKEGVSSLAGARKFTISDYIFLGELAEEYEENLFYADHQMRENVEK